MIDFVCIFYLGSFDNFICNMQAIPIIFGRLRQKLEEWKMHKAEMQKEWTSIVNNNYHKCLDYRALHFATSDEYQLNTRTILGEVRFLFLIILAYFLN
jgi:histone deacetylase complex regulatory component SIN3